MGKPSRTQHFAATLSLLLPGLGHVYLGRTKRGLALFVAFLLLTFFPEGRAFLPLAAILAAAEIYRPIWRTELARNQSRNRSLAFGFTGIASFMAWFTMFATVGLPFAYQATVNSDVDRIADLVRNYRAQNGALPASVTEAASTSAFVEHKSDPWGRDYEIARTESGFEVRSLGPDGKRDTRDDFRYSFR